MATLEERIAKLEQITGNWDTPPELSLGQTPIALPNGRYNLKESDYQLHVAVDRLVDTEEKATTISLEINGTEKVLVLTTKE